MDKLSSLPQFEVGEFVSLKSDNPLGSDSKSIYHIIERAVQECPAGTQIWYTCRGHHLKYKERVVTLQLVKFNEIELEEFKIADGKEDTINKKMRELSDSLNHMADNLGEGKPME